jgi:RNA polymerase sigma factor (sigma-70 family)
MSEALAILPLVDRPEAWVVAIAEHRDRDSFGRLFRCFAPKIKTYLMRHGMSDAIAEELTQETFLNVWRKADQFNPQRATASAWIYTIARNLRVDFLRRERHPDDRRVESDPDGPTTPEDELKSKQGETRLRMAMGALPAEQSAVLRMSFFEEKTHPQIANHLGLPLGTVKSRIRLAAAYLRSLLDD